MKALTLFVSWTIGCLAAGCATAPFPNDRSSIDVSEERESKHPWRDSMLGSPTVSDKQFDELPCWQQICACFSAMFVRGAYDSAPRNSERESR